MSDEEIINLWKQGLSIEKIINRIVKLENIKDEPNRKKKYNRVERVILKIKKRRESMSEKYNKNINCIEEAIKQLEDLKKDRLSFVTGDAEHDNIFLRDVQAIEIVLGNLEALSDMQKTADRELENAKKINEEHKRENGELRKKVKELEEENLHWRGQYYLVTRKIGVMPEQKIKNEFEKIQSLYEENLREVDLKKVEKIDRKILEGIRLEAQRDFARNLLQESEDK